MAFCVLAIEFKLRIAKASAQGSRGGWAEWMKGRRSGLQAWWRQECVPGPVQGTHCRGRCGHTETSEMTAAPGPSPRRAQKPLSHPTQSATAREERPLLAQGRDPADFRAMSPSQPPNGAVGAELAISDDPRLWPCGSCSVRSGASRLTLALAASGAGDPDPIRTAEDRQNPPDWQPRRARAEAAGGSAGGLQSPRIPGETARPCPCGPALLGWGPPLHPARPVTPPRLSPGLGSPSRPSPELAWARS